jgi:DNA polymerase-3 subunit epsilon
MHAAGQPSFKLHATGAPFEAKDRLKARGYRWDGEARVWFMRLGSDTLLQAELDWLKAEVYGGRRAQVAVERLDSATRYALRGGLQETRPL